MKTGKDVDKCLDIATQTCRQVWAFLYISTEHMLLAIIKDKEFQDYYTNLVYNLLKCVMI